MDTEIFNGLRKNKKEYIDEVINGYLPAGEEPQSKIYEAMNYSVLAGGKRLRPLLMLAAFEVFEGSDRDILEPFLAAIEMIHTYSLVHDDLPAMDNDEYRRGRKTTHTVYGEALGILAGDALLNYAFEIACMAFGKNRHCDRISASMAVLAGKSGIHGMLGGQVVDMEGFLGTAEKSRLDYMYQLKTGALLEASLMIGTILAGGSEEDVLKMEQLARNVGLAFQIQDDILDVTSTVEILGKPVLSDEKNNKVTYVKLLGLEESHQEVSRLTIEGLETLRSLNRNSEFLEALLTSLINRKS
ncbi:geranylgeranyl diphosphate synthase, type II [Anaerocolumna jejuensis DSM 15929]|uniref:Farnesyl diphosphate synthase n=1 Tax=Anaerocolumna jejuensis DSM 15929 TaxID=1121322 RepID=A0A1M6MJB7_9FIRM|nr:farnesyl diphosphate synthase [Anaerocolumna jejuensis]SHJ83562.1 geranylgeranyl diphosphate synthase, type II [Anaerocolumna jejuensis DSM 15929]